MHTVLSIRTKSRLPVPGRHVMMATRSREGGYEPWQSSFSFTFCDHHLPYFSEGKNRCIRRVGPPTTFSDVMGQRDIPAADGDSGYVFSSSGDHLLSFDLDTGLTVQRFGYDFLL
ncbi:hypothetical protein TRIP_B330658 [uncultured Desulfatiglans sp.]|uniref:Uncharacterized protein n=1 Tax=Uncultured Desulfatiglans sp. TaxID=1748965 RepID=A0A653A989_UNCDX|nr:hypothetical protein TRIP_B330658 [uncultured Desulfatiglans sp.]